MINKFLNKKFRSPFLISCFIPYFLAASISEESIQLDDSVIERNQDSTVNSYSDVLEGPQKAVVSVSTKVKMNSASMDQRQEFMHRFFGIPHDRIRPESGDHTGDKEEFRPLGLGSGVIISEDGYILTNNHVIEGERGDNVDKIEVSLADGRKFEAELVGSDPQTDVAVLKIAEEGLPFIKMANSDNLKVGDVVFAVGNPMGVGLTVTMGIVSAKERSSLNILGGKSYENFIQTDASINMGNSGGALVDSKGRLIGVNTAILSRSGGNIGIGFAIPIKMARSIMLSLVNQGEVRRGYLGVQIKNLTDELASYFNLPNNQGSFVEHVQTGTPAEEAGIKYGDVIVAVQGVSIKDSDALRLNVSQISPGADVEVTLIRESEELTLKVTLGDLETLSAGKKKKTFEIIKGIEVSELDTVHRKNYEIDEDVNGVVVSNIEKGSPYERGFKLGMVIIEINRVPVSSLNDCKDNLRIGMNGFYVLEKGIYKFLTIRN